jgi:hypothetical protein
MSSDVTIGRYINDDILEGILIEASETDVQSQRGFGLSMMRIEAHALSFRMRNAKYNWRGIVLWHKTNSKQAMVSFASVEKK